MALFIDQRKEQPASQGLGQRGPAQQCPGEEFDRHQLVMCKARQAAFPMLGIGQLARARQSMAATLHLQSGISCGPVDVNG
jgi:hypothetical protein